MRYTEYTGFYLTWDSYGMLLKRISLCGERRTITMQLDFVSSLSFNPVGEMKGSLRYADRWIEWLALSDGQKIYKSSEPSFIHVFAARNERSAVVQATEQGAADFENNGRRDQKGNETSGEVPQLASWKLL